ncbi:class I SAM-dependent methyltransferase [Chloroflexia bacterium SDU3-3]|nr:class I SAM-dependent methyltransferase [Chloroflexia bacterium SDU3-3]
MPQASPRKGADMQPTKELGHRRTLFDAVADEYDEIRPGYPDALVQDIIDMAGLPAGGQIFEIGCGTGQATAPFAQRGYRVDSIDIGPHMVARTAAKFAQNLRVSVSLGSFEDWDAQPGSYDLVMSATAFHWIDPALGYPKAARMLREGGAVAIFANKQPDPYDTPFYIASQEVYRRVVPEWASPEAITPLATQIERDVAAIDATGCFAPVTVRTYPWSVRYTTEQHIKLFNTYSDFRDLPDPTRHALYQGLAELIDTQFGGAITRSYIAVLYLARRA